ncbi:DNA-binding protein [Pedobacter frigidisoli]|uniref:DNA-binding protein n=1 Tax=Pedobacter frigidisoli TaxID=2530455 RepID=UPI00292E01F1|nr:DNA-binding protein [Pedobacter frigidisoli]
MNKFDQFLKLLVNVFLLFRDYLQANQMLNLELRDDEVLTLQQVKDYLKISEATYKRKVKAGVIRPVKMPGGERVLKSQLEQELNESLRKGRI